MSSDIRVVMFAGLHKRHSAITYVAPAHICTRHIVQILRVLDERTSCRPFKIGYHDAQLGFALLIAVDKVPNLLKISTTRDLRHFLKLGINLRDRLSSTFQQRCL